MKPKELSAVKWHMQRIESAILRQAPLRPDGWQSQDLLSAMQRENTPGVSVALVARGELALVRAYGVLAAGAQPRVTPETPFQAASISKPVASLTALSLVAEGRLGLDEDISACLTGWRLPANHGWQPRLSLRQLLSHSGGVTVDGFPGYAAGAPLPSLRQVLDGAPPANTPPVQVDTLPGRHFRYSGGGFCIVQQLIQDLTGLPFWQAARERVLEPLGMAHSSFRYPPPADLPPVAVGHRADGQPLAGGWHAYPESAAAGLWTTPSDLARLVIALEKARQGQTGWIISPSLAAEMLKPQIKVRDLGLNGWEGLSFFLTGPESDRYFGHGGSNEGYRCQLICRQGKGEAAIIMTNSDGGHALAGAWMDTVAVEFGWKDYMWVPPTAISIQPGGLERFCGKYRLADGAPLEIGAEKDGLVLRMAGQPPLVLARRSKNRFFLTQLNVTLRFVVEKGACRALVLSQNGEDLLARRSNSP